MVQDVTRQDGGSHFLGFNLEFNFSLIGVGNLDKYHVLI